MDNIKQSKNSKYLQPTFFLNFDDASVKLFAEKVCLNVVSPKDKAVKLYYAVRDQILYDPYDVQPSREAMRASTVLGKGSGYCVAKAVLLTAAARQQNIPARLGFADVTNHLSTRKLRMLMESNLFIYHGYTEFFLDNRWVKATPAFNLSLCTRFNVKPLEFDGTANSLFHEFDTNGQRHMEYVNDHGPFPDLPFERIFAAYSKQYPGMFKRFRELTDGNFAKEAAAENP